MTTDDQRSSRRRSKSIHTAVGGVHLACPSHPHSQPSERGAPEPRALLPPRKLGPDPPFGVSWQGFPHLTLVPERSRAPSGLVGSTASSASNPVHSHGGSTDRRRASAISPPARSPNCQNLRRPPMCSTNYSTVERSTRPLPDTSARDEAESSLVPPRRRAVSNSSLITDE